MSKKLTGRKWLPLFGLLVIAALAFSACSTSGGNIPNTGAATSAPVVEATATTMVEPTQASGAGATGPATVMVAKNDEYGDILVDSKGMTLYLFTKDEANKSNCNAGCMAKWPPLLTSGAPAAGDGVDASKLGTAPLSDGTTIVTYNGHPLYYWVNDKAAGDTTGQNVGEVWFVVSPAGDMVPEKAEAPTEMASTEASGTEMAPTAESGSGAAASGTTVMVSESTELGKFLVDGKGMTLYMFANDGPNKSNCTGGCLTNWPPYLSDSAPTAGDGVDASKLGTAKLDDGTSIVTYDSHPLYYWKNDAKPGDTTGQNVGSVWFVVAP